MDYLIALKKEVYIFDPTSLDPLLKWGVDLSKMRFRAFKLYEEDYENAEKVYPEFKEEYDLTNKK